MSLSLFCSIMNVVLQVYVALSRARSLRGLRVIGGFDASKVKANPTALEFVRALQEAQGV